MSCEGGKGGVKVVRWQGVKGGRVGMRQVAKEGRVMRWQGRKRGRVLRWQGRRFLVLFKGGRCRVRPRFRLFVSDVNQ